MFWTSRATWIATRTIYWAQQSRCYSWGRRQSNVQKKCSLLFYRLLQSNKTNGHYFTPAECLSGQFISGHGVRWSRTRRWWVLAYFPFLGKQSKLMRSPSSVYIRMCVCHNVTTFKTGDRYSQHFVWTLCQQRSPGRGSLRVPVNRRVKVGVHVTFCLQSCMIRHVWQIRLMQNTRLHYSCFHLVFCSVFPKTPWMKHCWLW
jgi:hypothetical protein